MITTQDYVEGFLAYLQDQDAKINFGHSLNFCCACRTPDTSEMRPRFHQYARFLCPTCGTAYETFLARLGAIAIAVDVPPLDPAQQHFLERQQNPYLIMSTAQMGVFKTSF